MIPRRPFAVLFLAGALLAAGPSVGGPVTFAYRGSLTQVAVLDPDSPFPDAIDFGSPFSGTYTFDSVAPNGIGPGLPNASYASTGGSFGITLSLGGLNFSYSGVTINVTNDSFAGDAYGVIHFESSCADPTCPDIEFTLQDPTGTALADLALPLLPPSLAGFLSFQDFTFMDTVLGNQVEVEGVIDSLTCTAGCAVPEPSTGLLAITALLFALRRKRPTSPSS